MKFIYIQYITVQIGRFQGANTSASFVQDDRPRGSSRIISNLYGVRLWVLHSKAFEAHALWHATLQWPWIKHVLKKTHWFLELEDLEVSVQDSLIRVFARWVLTKHVYWKKSWYGWILRISCSSPKPPTPYSHTANSIHFATCQIPENVSIFESIQESWKGWRQASETSCCRALRISDVTCSLYSFKWASLDLDNLDNCQNNKFDPNLWSFTPSMGWK